MIQRNLLFSAVTSLFLFAASLHADDGWTVLVGTQELAGFELPTGDWQPAARVTLDPANPKRFRIEPGTGLFVNGPKGKTTNLITKQSFGDLEAHVEFCIPKGSNSGVKFHGLYEVQILDSYLSKKKPSGDFCGGIYPRALGAPTYDHIDNGIPPLENACKAPGEWQTLDMIFLTPQFDAAGKKTASARMLKVVLNGKLVQDNVELKTPTGSNWEMPEHATGPFYLQSDHGPVAFRNVKIRPYKPAAKP